MNNNSSKIRLAAKHLLEDGHVDQALTLLGGDGYTNVQRVPSEFGQPGFGKGWGFGRPYEDWGYGGAQNTNNVPNTGNLPNSYDDDLSEDEEDVTNKKKKKQKEDIEAYAVSAGVYLDALLICDAEYNELFRDISYKVASSVGERDASEFCSWFGQEYVSNHERIAEFAEEQRLVNNVQRQKIRNVWKEILIPDIAPIMKRILKHLAVQFSVPYGTLTQALRGKDSEVAQQLADVLDGINPEEV